MFNEDRTVAVIFNSEIYNYPELRCAARQGSYVCHHQRHRGDRARLRRVRPSHFSQLNGMFAVALWDTRKRELIWPDRLGKALYYGTVRSFWFRAQAMLQHPRPGIDWIGPAAQVPGVRLRAHAAQPVPSHPQIVEGSYAQVRSGEPVQVHRYWDLRFSSTLLTSLGKGRKWIGSAGRPTSSPPWQGGVKVDGGDYAALGAGVSSETAALHHLDQLLADAVSGV